MTVASYESDSVLNGGVDIFAGETYDKAIDQHCNFLSITRNN